MLPEFQFIEKWILWFLIKGAGFFHNLPPGKNFIYHISGDDISSDPYIITAMLKSMNQVINSNMIVFDPNDNLLFITSRLSLNVNDEEMKAKEFKFEETEFYKLKNILIPEQDNLDEIINIIEMEFFKK